jgi:zinc transport system permease protein
MALLASFIGMLSVGGGLFGSYQWDLPAGPAIVTAAALVFFLTLAQRQR